VHFVYILRLKDKSYYIGYSDNLRKRISEHKRGLVKTTKNLLPLILIYYSAFKNRQRAISFERYLKEGSGFAFRNKHLT
jgi:predicted GIY-YIG superfamily endonuclease